MYLQYLTRVLAAGVYKHHWVWNKLSFTGKPVSKTGIPLIVVTIIDNI